MNIHRGTASVRVVYNRAREEGRAMHSHQRGNRLGPYQLGVRYRNTGSLGRVYRAHNVETGAPALVLQRTERQAEDQPLADWRVRVTSSVSPAYLALEVESAPASGDQDDITGELVFMLEDAANAANATVNRPETLPHLYARASPAPLPRPAARRWQRPALVAGLAALAAAAVLHLGSASAPGSSGLHAGAELAQLGDAGEDGGSEASTGLVLTSTTDDAPFLLARALPKKPFSNQKRPPCDKQLEVELNGGCWVRLKVDGICPPDKAFEHQGDCYLPAAKPETSPTAIERKPLAFDRE